MSFELIFLTILVVGIVMVGVGLIRQVRGYGRKAIGAAGSMLGAGVMYSGTAARAGARVGTDVARGVGMSAYSGGRAVYRGGKAVAVAGGKATYSGGKAVYNISADVATVSYGWGRQKVTSYAKSLGTDVKESSGRFVAANRAYREMPLLRQQIEEIRELESQGQISPQEAMVRERILTRQLERRLAIYERGTRGLQRGLESLYEGGRQGRGIYGERGEGTIYGESKGLLEKVGFPSQYVGLFKNLGRWGKSIPHGIGRRAGLLRAVRRGKRKKGR